ncbi:MAG TPA: hypothetical protein VFI73_01905 [Candidatus Nitrosopolaris sp.]|nr:hypothetical protein [Candidatus Nitrosopolaris sp.]
MSRKILISVSITLALFMLLVTSATSSSPVLAQPQLFSNGHSGAMSFGSPNFMNNIFNASSISGIVGISLANGVKVTGENLGNNEISVTLKHVTTSSNSSIVPSVTVTALRLPVDLKGLMSLAAASRGTGGNNTGMLITNNTNPMNAMMGQGFGGLGGRLVTNGTTQNNPLKALGFFRNIQIGSSSIINADWRSPQTTSMGLIGGSSMSNTSSSADFVIIIVIPYTGKTSNLSG